MILQAALQQINDSYIRAILEGAVTLTGSNYLLVIGAAIAGVSAIPFLNRLSAEWKLIAPGMYLGTACQSLPYAFCRQTDAGAG